MKTIIYLVVLLVLVSGCSKLFYGELNVSPEYKNVTEGNITTNNSSIINNDWGLYFDNITFPYYGLSLIRDTTSSYIKLDCEGYLTIEWENLNMSISFGNKTKNVDIKGMCMELMEADEDE